MSRILRERRTRGGITINTRELDNIIELNDYVFNHGVDFESLMDIEASIATIEDNRDIHICCSYEDEYVGGIGVAVSGDVKCAFNRDVFSSKCNDGSRTIFFRNIEDMNSSLISSVEDIGNNTMYGEAIVTNSVIHYVWVKASHEEKYSEIINSLSSKYRVYYV